MPTAQTQESYPAQTQENSSREGDTQQSQQSASDSFQLSPPAVSLPKGGGAIKGIDEKFSVNPATGTASLSVPIVTTPGRQGFSPQLTLQYNSGAGNGPFGFGWNVSVPAITRKTDKGLPQYLDVEESDIFLLSGAEDLVPVLVRDDENWEEEVVPEMTLDGETYSVRRYRPRTEGLFARIERWTNVDTGDLHWRSVTKENVTSIYGFHPEHRITDPQDGRRVFSWLLEETYDDKGNVIVYEYKQENAAEVDLARPHERNRPGAGYANRHLKRIRYGNSQPRPQNIPATWQSDPPTWRFETLWHFEVVFDYGEHNVANPTPNESQPWPARPDAFSSYRAGFEIRTQRLCQRVLMFHHFPGEEGFADGPTLVRSTDFAYERSPTASFLTSATQTGYVRREDADGYKSKSLPPLEFTYTKARIDRTVQSIDSESLEHLPIGLDGPHYRWVDLDGEGLSGVLAEHTEGWLYKRNLGTFRSDANRYDAQHPPEPPAPREPGQEPASVRFAPARQVATQPAVANLQSGGQQIMDLAGDGQKDLVLLGGAVTGFYERENGHWASFIPFESAAQVPWGDPNLRLIDLNGDGHADILMSEDEVFVWHPSRAEDGFGPFEMVQKLDDEEQGPALVFADATQSIYLADMSGDGLNDIARIRNGEVYYWPNLGYGRFGAKVTMNNAPYFDVSDLFNQNRIRLADIDGSGTTDIIYLGRDAITLWFNQSGNSWPEKPERITGFPHIDNLSDVQVIDLQGNGTACLVWSSPLPADAAQPMRYIELMGGTERGHCRQKPHLLHKVINNMGAERTITYAPSTKFYLADRAAGTPWITRLPFPVHVVETVEQVDHISRTRYVSRYRYHHGYFDGHEREFRGFGMVEQWDTDLFPAFAEHDPFSESPHGSEEEHNLPPVYTKTWFHTGAYVDRRHISRQFEEEYYDGDPEAKFLPDTVLPDEDLTAEEAREAARAFKGRMLRQEVYAVDGKDEAEHPYTVTEQNFGLRMLQPRQNDQHAVFLAHNREAISYHYERNPDDPRISHAFTLDVDEHSGKVTRSANAVYPRRAGAAETIEEQSRLHVTYTEADFINETEEDAFYLVGVPLERRRYEVTGRDAPVDRLFRFDEVDDLTANAEPIDYEDTPNADTEQKRLLKRTRTRYYSDDLATPLPPDELTAPLLRYESYQAAFSTALLTDIFGEKFDAGTLETILGGRESDEGAYVEEDGLWWIPSGRRVFDPAHFYLPVRIITPFDDPDATDDHFAIRYDGYDLLTAETEDQLGNVVQAENNYRTLQPEQITGPNGNRSQVAFDALGMVVGMAVMGKEDGDEEVGDTLETFDPDLDKEQIRVYLDADDPTSGARELLSTATTRLVYDVWRYQDTKTDPQPQPPMVWTLAREQHVSDLDGEETPAIQHSFLYSDGLGREVLTKAQAEPGPLQVWDSETEEWCKEWNGAEGEPFDPRWVGTGRTVFNNKGKPVKKYEPFFSETHRYQREDEVVMQGVTPILRYDPLGRLVRTDNPDGTFSRVEFDPWQQTTWDENDTVILDEDGHRLESEWYTEKTGPDATAAERDAAAKAADHAGTPTTQYLDTLGRPFLSLAHNVTEGTDEHIPTYTELDIEGNPLAIYDGRGSEGLDIAAAVEHRGNTVMEYRLRREVAGEERIIPGYDMAGRQLYQNSMDAGERRVLPNVAGDPIRAWDSRGHTLTMRYDVLQRPTHRYVQPGDEEYAHSPLYPDRVDPPGYLAEQTVYGDSPEIELTEDEALACNLRGQVYRQYDGAGVVTNVCFDFKGNLLESQRQLLVNYRSQVNWAADSALEDEIFTSRTTYDALDRPVQVVTPHNAETLPNVIQPTYNEANLLEQVDVWLQRASAPDGLLERDSANLHPVTDIDYDAKGQRTRIDYGNGATTTYGYDPRSFRLTRLLSTRPAAPGKLQDLGYTYDPVGNITALRDDAQQAVFFANTVVEPSATYRYDALYRLVHAEGREHAAQHAIQRDERDIDPVEGIPFPNSPEALLRYVESYVYDSVGNIRQMDHRQRRGDGSPAGGWTRHYRYAEESNRLLETSRPDDDLEDTLYSYRYDYNDHGSMTRMPHLPLMQWDVDEQLRASSQQVRDDGGTPETTYYLYNASGQRVRKVTDRQAAPDEDPERRKERLYLGGFEIYREYNGGGEPALERESLHVMDDQQRIALVETRTQGNDDSLRQLTRYQLGNHLGSACLELDEVGAVISYEEYHPYGTTAYQAGRSDTEVSLKRFRYTGKERDEETGLNYHGARYYAPWAGRWCSTDPLGPQSGQQNVYGYVSANPLRYFDPNGADEHLSREECRRFNVHPQKRESFKIFGFEELERSGASRERQREPSPQERPTEPRKRPTYAGPQEFLPGATLTPPDLWLGQHTVLGSKPEPPKRGGWLSRIETKEVLENMLFDIMTGGKVNTSTLLKALGFKDMGSFVGHLEALKTGMTASHGGFAGASLGQLYKLVEGYYKTLSDAIDIPHFRGKIVGYADALARWAKGESIENLANVPDELAGRPAWVMLNTTKSQEGYREGAKRVQETLNSLDPEQVEVFKQDLINEFTNPTDISRRDIREAVEDRIRETHGSKTRHLMQGM